MTADRRNPPGVYRAVAADFDGTLVEGSGPPGRAVIEALGELRSAGIVVFLATGRIFAELLEVWPEVLAHVDCVVAENGGVLQAPSWRRLLAPPVDRTLDGALRAHRLPFRRGEVILAASVHDEAAILGLVRARQLGCQTVANRQELMVVPAGVTKGSGLGHALAHFGVSIHNTIVIGDAENDVALFSQSELAVAVANAVEPLKAEADLVLTAPDGQGIVSFLREEILRGVRAPRSRRWQLVLGRRIDGQPLAVPASRINLLIVGEPGSGKSYLAGGLVEQLADDQYVVLVIDPEGDHAGLHGLSSSVVLGGHLPLPAPEDVVELFHQHGGPVVIDLSGLLSPERQAYQGELLTVVDRNRARSGLPHWIFLDEADQALGSDALAKPQLDVSIKGFCFVTWRPGQLDHEVLATLDAVVALDAPSTGRPEESPSERGEASAGIAAPLGGAVLIRAGTADGPHRFTMVERESPHLRHIHKYEHRPLEVARQFHFRSGTDQLTGLRAANLTELGESLAGCELAVLRHHCPAHDFSRWVVDVFHDPALGLRMKEIEAPVRPDSPTEVIERARQELVSAVFAKLARERRHSSPAGTPEP